MIPGLQISLHAAKKDRSKLSDCGWPKQYGMNMATSGPEYQVLGSPNRKVLSKNRHNSSKKLDMLLNIAIATAIANNNVRRITNKKSYWLKQGVPLNCPINQPSDRCIIKNC